ASHGLRRQGAVAHGARRDLLSAGLAVPHFAGPAVQQPCTRRPAATRRVYAGCRRRAVGLAGLEARLGTLRIVLEHARVAGHPERHARAAAARAPDARLAAWCARIIAVRCPSSHPFAMTLTVSTRPGASRSHHECSVAAPYRLDLTVSVLRRLSTNVVDVLTPAG